VGPQGSLRHQLQQTPSAILKILDLGTSVDVFLKRTCVLFALAGTNFVVPCIVTLHSKYTRALTFQHFFTADGSVLVFCANGGAEARDGEAGAGAGAGEGGGAGAGWSKWKTHSLFVLSGHRSQVMHVRWSPRHHYLYAQTSDGQVYVWLLHTSKPAELLRKISRLDAPLVLQALETPSSSIPQHTDGELAKNETADDSKLFGNGVGGGGAGAGGLGLSGGFFEENEENDEGLLPIEKRSLALHHPGPWGTGPGEYLSVILI